jgi:hypothetical protein
MQKELLSNLLGNIGYYYGTLVRKFNNFGRFVDKEDT